MAVGEEQARGSKAAKDDEPAGDEKQLTVARLAHPEWQKNRDMSMLPPCKAIESKCCVPVQAGGSERKEGPGAAEKSSAAGRNTV